MKDCYKKENLEPIVKTSFSYAEVLRKIGRKEMGSNYLTIKKYIAKYKLDISHFTGQLWNKGKTEKDNPNLAVLPIDKILSNKIGIKTANLKEKLYILGYKEKQCEICGVGEEWQGKPLILELHHIDGNRYNNSLENLQILCPNCHSQTDNFRGKGERTKKPKYEIIKKEKLVCQYCGKEFYGRKYRKFCSVECSKLAVKEKTEISKEKLLILIDKHDTLASISKELLVTSKTVKKYLKKYDLLDKFKSKTKEI